MHYFFYGQNTYGVAQKIKELKDRFLATDKNGLNLEVLDGEELDFSRFDQVVSTLPFLGQRRLVIIKNLLAKNSDNDLKSKIADRIKKTSQEIVIVFCEEGNPDKRGKLFKTLSSPQRSKNFLPLSGYKLEQWIINKGKESGIIIDTLGAKKLAISLGSDLWRQDMEIKKLSLYFKFQGQNKIDSTKIDQLIVSNVEPNVFDLIDFMSRKNLKMVYRTLYKFYSKGENENYLFSMITYQIRNLIKVSDLIRRGSDRSNISKEANLHPFVAKKIVESLNNFNYKRLLTIYDYLYQSDIFIKTGKIDQAVALDLCVAKISLI